MQYIKTYRALVIPILGVLLVLPAMAADEKKDASSATGDATATDRDAARASELFKPTRVVTYKQVGDVTLKMSIFEPAGHKPTDRQPAIVFFHGGGFLSGRESQFYAQSNYLADRGMVCFSAQYRVKKKHGTDPDASVMDAKSAMRWVRSHAKELGVDPDRIAAGGGSAGGTLTVAVAALNGFDEKGEDTIISCRPNALVVFNAPLDFGPDNWGHKQAQRILGERWIEFSPLHQIKAPFPPMIMQVGDQDKLISVEAIHKIEAAVKAADGQLKSIVYPGQPHGFFNYGRGDRYFQATLIEVDKFLAALGWLKGDPNPNSDVFAKLDAADAPDSEAGFETIFDGKSLDGWLAPDMTFWRVEDGAITGEVTADRKPKENVFLVWQKGKVANFELRFKFRIIGKSANSGMQFRSEVKERGLVHGYQADMSGDGKWTGGIFDEYGPRGSLAARGTSTTWNADGSKLEKPQATDFKMPDTTQWTDYHIIARGEHIVLKINGVVTAELHDGDKRQRKEGILAMPIIPAEMKVQYKDLRLKKL
jgi:acetyl esterase